MMRPEDDATLPKFGIGVTGLVKGIAQSHDRGLDYSKAAEVAGHILVVAPAWVAFNGQTAGGAAAAQLGLARRKDVRLGEQEWRIGSSRVFVPLPSSSGAHATMSYAKKLEWWRQLSSMAAEYRS